MGMEEDDLERKEMCCMEYTGKDPGFDVVASTARSGFKIYLVSV